MPEDLRALLAAIVADPADDTARLVYADCLEEHGSAVRAAFIRLQIEAERLHPDSSTRAAIERQAQALLAEHWINWWGEVCSVVGLPVPVPRSTGAIGRLARRVGLANPPGHPYELSQFTVQPRSGVSYDQRLDGWWRTTFRRGFPDTVEVLVTPNVSTRAFLPRWLSGAPLGNLCDHGPWVHQWPDGPHLAGISGLTLREYDPDVLLGAFHSPHMPRLEALMLEVPTYEWERVRETFTDELARMVASPRMGQLRRLILPLWSDQAAEVFATAPNVAGLESLEVNLRTDFSEEGRPVDWEAPWRRIAILARSPYLGGLRELKVIGELDAAGIETATRTPTWTGLRKLELDFALSPGPLEPLTGPDDLPELEELRLTGVTYTVAAVNALVRAPLLKRLRHFATSGGPPLSVDFDIAGAVDADRIETFAIGNSEVSPRVIAQLREHFGDRLRVYGP